MSPGGLFTWLATSDSPDWAVHRKLRQRLAAEASDEQRQQPEHDEARSRQCGLCQERLREFHWPIPTPA